MADRTVQIPFKLYDKLTTSVFSLLDAVENPQELKVTKFDDGTGVPITRVVYFTNKDFGIIKELARMIRDERS